MECGRFCLATFNCSSTVIHPATRTCFLSSLNRCTMRNVLALHEGYFYYEMQPGNRTLGDTTCFSTCMKKNNNCNVCGRPNCWGSKCENFPHYCWDLRPLKKGTLLLWLNTSKIIKVSCDYGWQKIWPSKLQIPNIHLLLAVRIVYMNDEVVNSTFSSVAMANGVLSVGDYIEGVAGNEWGAPFTNRTLVKENKQSTCKSFFYSTNNCEAQGVRSVEEQLKLYNGTIKHRGFNWITGITSKDSLEIKDISLWVKPAE
ncbi:uncharacterized protein LOC121853196 [Homarus americanus]|nr:uncharacterized protein LOC121853196 [Homarus americanus]